MLRAIKGYKTYIIATLMTLVAVVHLLTGDISLVEFVQDPYFVLLLEGLGIAALRNAISDPSRTPLPTLREKQPPAKPMFVKKRD